MSKREAESSAHKPEQPLPGSARELTDAELETVVGGFNPQPDPPKLTRPSQLQSPILRSPKLILPF